jgi:hypothetical protein
MKNLVKSLIVISAMIFLFTSCNSDDNPETESSVKVVLTDGPFPFNFATHANVGIAKIELKKENGEYVTVFEGNESYNMVELTNGVTADVETTPLNPGVYAEARVTFNAANVVLSNGNTFQANVANSTHVVSIDPVLVVEEGETSEVLFDLDLDNSFSFTNTVNLPFLGWISSIDAISGCHFQPHLRACNFHQTGEIHGTVNVGGNLFEGADVSIVVDGNVIHTHSEADGTFKFIGIKAGTYTVSTTTQDNGSTQVGEIVVNVNGTATCTVEIN